MFKVMVRDCFVFCNLRFMINVKNWKFTEASVRLLYLSAILEVAVTWLLRYCYYSTQNLIARVR